MSEKNCIKLLSCFLVFIAIEILIQKPSFSLIGDNLVFNLPFFSYIGESWKNLKIPIWAPYIFGGQSIIGNPQSGIFYPFYWLPFSFIPKIYALDVSIILHIIISSFGMYYLLKNFDCQPVVSLIGSISYSLNGIILLFYSGCLQMAASISWTPYILGALITFCKSPSLKKSIILSLFLFIQFLTGYPQYFLYTFIILIIFFFYYFINNPSKILVRNFIYSIFIVIILISPLSIIILDTMLNTNRPININLSSGISYNFFIYPYLTLKQISSLFIPFFKGKFLGIYINLSPFFLGVVVILGLLYSFFQFKIKKIFFLLILFFISILLTLGPNFFWQKLLFHIPIYNLFRGPIKHLYEVVLFSVIVSSLAINKIKSKKIKYFLLIICLLESTINIIISKNFNINFFTKSGQQHYILKNKSLNNIYSPILFNALKEGRLFAIDGHYLSFNYSPLSFAYPMLFKIPSLNGYGPTIPLWESQLLGLNIRGFTKFSAQNILNSKRWLLNLFNVKYIIIKKYNYINKLKNFKIIKLEKFSYKLKSYYLLENKEVYGFVYFVKKVKLYQKFELIKKLGEENSILLKDVAFINKKKYIHDLKKGKVLFIEWQRKNPEIIKIKVKAYKNSFLVISLPYDKHWKVFINNKKSKIIKTNNLVCGLYFKKDGIKEIILKYSIF